MELTQRPDNSFLRLPPDCCFMMQQWLYRRTSHTRRYKRCYIVLHKDRLYSFRKPPTAQGAKQVNLEESLRQNSWVITGAEIQAEPHEVGGLFKWKILLKNNKHDIGDGKSLYNGTTIRAPFPRMPPFEGNGIEEIFQELNRENHVSTYGILQPAEDHTIWLATRNLKVAMDWLEAILCIARYGSLQNFVYQNHVRSKYLAFSLPFYMVPFDFIPMSRNKSCRRRWKSAFTFMKINIIELLSIPLISTDTVCCLAEYNSSFYAIHLPYAHQHRKIEVKKTLSNVSYIGDDTRDFHLEEDGVMIMKNKSFLRISDLTSAQLSARDSYNRGSGTRPYGLIQRSDFANTGDLIEEERIKQRPPNMASSVNQTQTCNMLSKLWNLNKTSEKKRTVIENRTMHFGQDAFVHIPMYRNESQDILWLHFVTTSDIYIGSASIDNSDFSITGPFNIKSCAIKHIEEINPFSYKRLDISDYPLHTSALKTSMVNEPGSDAGFVVVSVMTPKNYGNFMDPVTPAFRSSKEYLHKATNASTPGGLNMLSSNIKRCMNAYRTTYTIRRYVRKVLQFKNHVLSFFWMFYLILSLGFFPDYLLMFATLALMYYAIRCHPLLNESVIQFLLKYPIIMALLPRKMMRNLMLLPKPACIICAKRKSFLMKNSYQTCEEAKREIISLQRIQSAEGSVTAKGYDGQTPMEQLVYIEKYAPAMLTPTQAMKGYVSFMVYPGTEIERCKHKGVLQSYLSCLFLNQLAGSGLLSNLRKAELTKTVKALHCMFYEPPPYPWSVVPFFQNVVLTVKYYFMVFLLTFTGGINHIHILHLLHKNRVSNRLLIESVISESEQREREWHFATMGGGAPKAEVIPSEWYENERRHLLGTFSSMSLRFNERPRKSTEDGVALNIPDMLTYNAKVLVTTETDSYGWSYAKNWNSTWSTAPNVFTFVRRRKWVIGSKEHNRLKDVKVRGTVNEEVEGNPVPEVDIDNGNKVKLPRYISTRDSSKAKSIEKLHEARLTEQNVDPTTKERLSLQHITENKVRATSVAMESSSSLLEKGCTQRYNILQHLSLRKQQPLDQQTGSNVINILKKGLSALKKEPNNNSRVNSIGQAGTTQEAVNGAPGKWFRRSRQIISGILTPSMKPITVESAVLQQEESVSFSSHVGEVQICDPPNKEQALDDEDWVTDYEDQDEAATEMVQSEKRTLLNSAIAFVFIMPLCVILDIFKIVFKVMLTTINVLFWFFGISREDDVYDVIPEELPSETELGWKKPRTRCSIVSQGRQNYIKIATPKKRCFMGRRILEIYKAAKGRKSRLRAFTRSKGYRNMKIMYLYTSKRDINDEIESEDDSYDTFYVESENENLSLEKRVDSKVYYEAESEHISSDNEVSSNESVSSDGVRLLVSLQEESMDVDMNNFVLDDQSDDARSDIDMKEEQVAQESLSQQKHVKIYSYIKNIYERKLKKSHVEASDTYDAGEGAKQPSEYEGGETHGDMKAEHKLSVIGMLRKAKDRIAVANYYLNLYAMRYEKFINMIQWRHYSVTKVVLIMLMALVIGNLFVSTNVLLLVYMLLYFKSGYAHGMWERNLLHTVERNLEVSLANLEIYRPFWDLSNKQVVALTKAITGFCQVEVPSTTIRESENKWELAQAITTLIIEQKMCRGWSRTNWFINLFRQSPDLLEA